MDNPNSHMPPDPPYWSNSRRIALALAVGLTIITGLLLADWWLWRYAHFGIMGGNITFHPGPTPAFLRDLTFSFPLPPTDPFILIGATLAGLLSGTIVYVVLTFLAHRQARPRDL